MASGYRPKRKQFRSPTKLRNARLHAAGRFQVGNAEERSRDNGPKSRVPADQFALLVVFYPVNLAAGEALIKNVERGLRAGCPIRHPDTIIAAAVKKLVIRLSLITIDAERSRSGNSRVLRPSGALCAAS